MTVRKHAEAAVSSKDGARVRLTNERDYLRRMAQQLAPTDELEADARAARQEKADYYNGQADVLEKRLLELELERQAAAAIADEEKAKDDAAELEAKRELERAKKHDDETAAALERAAAPMHRKSERHPPKRR